MTREEALKVWLPVIKMGVEPMPECNEALDMAIKALEQEPKMGHWKLDTLKIRAFGTKNETYDYSVYCDNCGYTWDYTTDKKGSLVSNFCPNCGLKMESMEE